MAVVNYTPATWVSGTVPPAATFNTEIRDFSVNLQSAWTAYTPALSSTGTAITMGTGSTVAGTYQQLGKTIYGASEIVAGTSGFTAGTGSYKVSLPVAMVAAAPIAGRVCGQGIFFDSSVGTFYHLILVASTSTLCTMIIDSSTAIMSAASPVVPANNDQWRYSFMYQAA